MRLPTNGGSIVAKTRWCELFSPNGRGSRSTESLDAKPFVSLELSSGAHYFLEVPKHAEHHPREFMIQTVSRQTDLALPDCRAPLGTGHSQARLIRASFPAGAGQKPPSVPRD